MKYLANSKFDKLQKCLSAKGMQLNNDKFQFMIIRKKVEQSDSKMNILVKMS